MAGFKLVLTTLAVGAVVGMSGWVAHICLRRRPDWQTVIINLSFWVVPVALLAGLTGQPWKSFGLGTALVFLLQRLHWLKWKYLADTLTVIDFRLALNRASWLVLRLYPSIAAYAVTSVTGLALSWFLMPSAPPLGRAARIGAVLVAAGLIAFDARFRHRHEFAPFGFNVYGHFANLLFSASSLRYRPPEVTGDGAIFRERASRLPAPAATARTGSMPPDIVLWLQESATDPRIYDVPGASLPLLSMHRSDPSTLESGWLRVPSWGGGTWLSEFALLTGLSHEDFGAAGQGVYYTVTPHLRFSLPRLLQRHGYRCVVLFPLEKTVYNSESAYRDLGIDEVLNPLDFPEWRGRSLTDSLVEDQDLFTYALRILNESQARPVFLFMLSMIQHGPYDPGHAPRFGLERSTLDRATIGRFSDWLDRMQKLSADTIAFEQALRATGRDVLFAYFGDHQPNLGAAIPYIHGIDDPRYLTRFAIKGEGVPSKAGDAPEVLDSCFLGSLLLEHAGIPADELFAANAAMRRLCHGALRRCCDRALADSYRAHLYRELLAAGPMR